MEVIIDDIAQVLSVADANKILDEFYRKGKGGGTRSFISMKRF